MKALANILIAPNRHAVFISELVEEKRDSWKEGKEGEAKNELMTAPNC